MKTVFSPSPIGPPSLGLLRTAVFNWALARHYGGSFVVRMEDTNTALIRPEAYRQMLDLLDWMGLDWDEGPGVGGPHAPYLQSERTELYREFVDQLVSAGELYESFSTPDEVERRTPRGDHRRRYDNADRHLTAAHKASLRAEGRLPSLRLRLPPGEVVVHDFIRGPVRFNLDDFADPVLVRSSGWPTYALAGPVDDALMGITHKFVGEDLLPFAPRRLAVYAALGRIGVIGETVPAIAHLALVHDVDGALLSARTVPQANGLFFPENGWSPDALVNYLASIGWAMPDGRTYYTPDEFVSAFSSDRIRVNAAHFDLQRLAAINAWHLRQMSDADYLDALTRHLYPTQIHGFEAEAALARLTPVLQTATRTLAEAADAAAFLLASEQSVATAAAAGLAAAEAKALPAIAAALQSVPDWTASALRISLRELSLATGVERHVLYTALCWAVLGRRSSSVLIDSVVALGRPGALRRLSSARRDGAPE